MKENDPSVVFKIQTSEEKLPERPVEDVVSDNKNEQNKLDLKSLKKEVTLEDLMDFLKKEKINPEEKTIEKYYKEIIDSKKDRETILNVVKQLESKKEEIVRELDSNPNNSEVLKKLQEINGKIGDLNTSEYLITDNIKNIVKNITNEFPTTNENNETNTNNNVLNQNIYKFLTENVEQKFTEDVKNINEKIENSLSEKIIYDNKENLPKENIDNLETEKNLNSLKEQIVENEKIENIKTENQNFENNLKEENNNTSNIFNNIFKENESLSLNTNVEEPKISQNVLKPNFLEKEYKDENRISLSNLENVGEMFQEAKKVISGQNESLKNLETKDFENEFLESVNAVEGENISIKDVGAIESDDIENIVQPENKLALDSLMENANELGNSNIAQNDLEHEMRQFEEGAIKQPLNGEMGDKFENLNVKDERNDFNLKDMNPISENANVLENLNTLSSEMGDVMKIAEPDYILEETRKTNGLIENLAKIMSEGFNGLMGSMANAPKGMNMGNGQNMVNETMNPHAPNPKIIQPNWITGYRDGVREGTGVTTALGYKTKLRGDNLGLYI